MATVHGKDATFAIDDAGGTSRVITVHCSSVELSMNQENAEDTHFADSFRGKIPGLKDWSLSIEGSYDTTADTGADTVLGGLGADTTPSTLSVSFSPDGGTITYAGEVVLDTYSISTPVDDKISFSADFSGAGTLTRS